MLLDFLIGGLVVGGIYALIAIGLNLQYGVARVLNLAYGEFLMLGGDFDDHVLGFLEPFPTTLSAADYYRYSLGFGASFNGQAPVLTHERSHLFLVQNTDGLSLSAASELPGV